MVTNILSKKDISISYKHKWLANHYLTQITILQEQIDIEEQKLLKLLKTYGTKILPEPEAVFQVSKTN